MKWQIIGLGGNVEALETNYKGYQILISNGFGDRPEIGGTYRIDLYAKGKSIEFTDKPLKTYKGKRLNLSKVTAKAKQYINQRLARSKRS